MIQQNSVIEQSIDMSEQDTGISLQASLYVLKDTVISKQDAMMTKYEMVKIIQDIFVGTTNSMLK